VTSLTETWITVLGHHNGRTTFYNLYSLIEILLWALIFRGINKIQRPYFTAIVVVILLASVVEIVCPCLFDSFTT